MNDIAYGQLLGTKTTEAKVYQLMETSIIVAGEFGALLRNNELNEDYIDEECDTDTYSNLIDIALEIEKQNTDENPIYIDDIRGMAEEMILKEYGKKKKYEVTRNYYKTVTVEANTPEEAMKIANEKDLFATVTLDAGEDIVNG